MKQTAVEWLIKKLVNRQNGVFDGLPHLSVDEIFNRAKEMEREQHFETYRHEYPFFISDSLEFKGFFNEYYNKTYKNEQ